MGVVFAGRGRGMGIDTQGLPMSFPTNLISGAVHTLSDSVFEQLCLLVTSFNTHFLKTPASHEPVTSLSIHTHHLHMTSKNSQATPHSIPELGYYQVPLLVHSQSCA